MQWRERREPLQMRDHTMIDQYGTIVIGTAVDDPMADREWAQLQFIPQPRIREHHGGRNIRDRLYRKGAVRQDSAGGAGGAQPSTAADPVHLPFDLPAQPPIAIHGELLELDA